MHVHANLRSPSTCGVRATCKTCPGPGPSANSGFAAWARQPIPCAARVAEAVSRRQVEEGGGESALGCDGRRYPRVRTSVQMCATDAVIAAAASAVCRASRCKVHFF